MKKFKLSKINLIYGLLAVIILIIITNLSIEADSDKKTSEANTTKISLSVIVRDIDNPNVYLDNVNVYVKDVNVKTHNTKDACNATNPEFVLDKTNVYGSADFKLRASNIYNNQLINQDNANWNYYCTAINNLPQGYELIGYQNIINNNFKHNEPIPALNDIVRKGQAPFNLIYSTDNKASNNYYVVYYVRNTDPKTNVIPITPTLDNKDCNKEPKLVLPQQNGVDYTYTKKDNKYYIDAKPKPGYTFKNNIKTSWVLDIVKTPCLIEVTPIKPYLSDIGCGKQPQLIIPDQKGVKYEVSRNNKQYHINAVAAKGYKLKTNVKTNWVLNITVHECESYYTPEEETSVAPAKKDKVIEVTPLEPTLVDKGCNKEPELVIPTQEGVVYEYTKKDNKYYIVALAEEGYTISTKAKSDWALDIVIEGCPINTDQDNSKNDTNSHLVVNEGKRTLGIFLIFSILVTGLVVKVKNPYL